MWCLAGWLFWCSNRCAIACLVAFALLIAGGLVYTGGALLFLNPRLPYRRAVWHAFVCAGAGLHFAAIAGGVVLGPTALS